MRIKIEMEMSGNQLLDLLRRVPKSVAIEIKNSVRPIGDAPLEQKELLSQSIDQLIDRKKR